MVITKEWLEYEIGKLGKELEAAAHRKEDAFFRLARAENEYKAAHEAVQTLRGCIRGLKDELAFTDDQEPGAGEGASNG